MGVSPWPEGQKATTLAGRQVWWEDRNGERVVMPDEVVVERVASKVSNGEVVSFLSLRGCVRADKCSGF